jgi:hypothetical protein
MTADVSSPVTTSRTIAMSEMLDRIVFRHTFQKFSPNHIQAHISLNITQMYNNMAITEVHTPIYMTIIEVHTSNIDRGSAQNAHEQYAACLVHHQPNHIGQHY